MKRMTAFLLCLLLLPPLLPVSAFAEEHRIEPSYPVRQSIQWVLDTASGEVGYREGDHGWSKYGEWAGDPYAQWCAEFLCWCVDQVDHKHGTDLLRNVYPMYSGQNVGLRWFVTKGRFVSRNGNVDEWGYQWLSGSDHFLTVGEYIPQPGDWVFFTWTSDSNTDHVAMVEYCTADDDGNVTIHVIEGNAPVAVARNTYPLEYRRILGYGTVNDVMEITMKTGCSGVKVSQLQKKLQYLGYLENAGADGNFGAKTQTAVRTFQEEHGLRVNGIANLQTQNAIDTAYYDALEQDPAAWTVVDDED